MQVDLQFLGGEFLDLELAKDQTYLDKYFASDIQFAFLRYYLVFGSVDQFIQHTGIHAEKKYLRRLEAKYHRLVKLRTDAKKNFDFDLLWRIETGRYKFS